jgi:hypothetical protein
VKWGELVAIHDQPFHQQYRMRMSAINEGQMRIV